MRQKLLGHLCPTPRKGQIDFSTVWEVLKAKILIGVAMIHQCQTSEVSASKFKAQLDEFYADSPERLKSAQFGLTLTVKKPVSDLEQD